MNLVLRLNPQEPRRCPGRPIGEAPGKLPPGPVVLTVGPNLELHAAVGEALHASNLARVAAVLGGRHVKHIKKFKCQFFYIKS